MLVKHLKYKDFNDEEREADFYFNLSRDELTEMQIGQRGGMETYLTNVVNQGDNRKIIDVLIAFIHASFGVRSDDGAAFLKRKDDWDYFKGSGAYGALFLELVGSTDNPNNNAILDFMTGIIPADLRSAAEERRRALDAQAAAVPGFRPGADTSRPTPPVAGEPATPAPTPPAAATNIPDASAESVPQLGSIEASPQPGDAGYVSPYTTEPQQPQVTAPAEVPQVVAEEIPSIPEQQVNTFEENLPQGLERASAEDLVANGYPADYNEKRAKGFPENYHLM